MLKTGQKVPGFNLTDQNGQLVSLYDLLKEKCVVLYFYPKDETPGCIKEACAFRDSYEDFIAAGAEVVGVSADSVQSHHDFAKNRNLPFILLSDADRTVHKAYDLSPGFFGLLSPRATYVINQKGIIQMAFSSHLMIDSHISEALSVIKKLAED